MESPAFIAMNTPAIEFPYWPSMYGTASQPLPTLIQVIANPSSDLTTQWHPHLLAPAPSTYPEAGPSGVPAPAAVATEAQPPRHSCVYDKSRRLANIVETTSGTWGIVYCGTCDFAVFIDPPPERGPEPPPTDYEAGPSGVPSLAPHCCVYDQRAKLNNIKEATPGRKIIMYCIRCVTAVSI